MRARPCRLAALAALAPAVAPAQVPPPPAAVAQPSLSQPALPPAIGAGDIVVNMHDVEIAAVADQVSRLTGRTLILDPEVRGRVTVTSATPLTAAGVWDLFRSVLRVHGYAAVASGRAWRIVPEAEAVRSSGTRLAAGASLVSRMIRLRTLAPDAAARILRPLVAQFGSVEPVASPPGVVVTDYADNVARVERLAAQIDGGSGRSFDTIPLAKASAKDVGQAIRTLLGEGDAAPKVAVDERTNTVLVRGDARLVAEARRMATALDRGGGATPTLRVFRLRFADAESVTQVLAGLLGAQAQANNPVARSLSADALPGAGVSQLLGANSPYGGASGSPFGGAVAQNGLPTNGTTAIGGSTTGSTSSLQPLGGGQQQQSTGFATADLAVQSAPELNALVVRGSPAAIAELQPLVDQLDVRRPQVLIEAAIAEITGDTAEALGIQLGLGKGLPGLHGAVTNFSNIGGASLTSVLSTLGVPLAAAATGAGLTGAISGGDNFQLLVEALGSSSKANLLSTPSITTLDNQPAQIVVGQNVPFRTGSYTTLAGGTTSPFTTIERQDVGLTLRIVPRVHEGDTVRLEVAQEVSSLVGAVSGAADLITNRRAIQTSVVADDGQTIVLGGLISDDRTDAKSQVPVLGDIPVLGNLFKSRQLERTRRTLFVFLRPTILRTPDQVAQAAQGSYGQLRGAEAGLADTRSLLLDPPKARLPQEIDGIY